MEHENMQVVDYILEKEEYLYKVYHYYGREEHAIYFTSKIRASDLIEILACIDFKFEEIVDETRTMDNESLLKILEEFYNVKKLDDILIDKIKNIAPKELTDNRSFIPGIIMPKIYNIYNNATQLIVIDRFSAREIGCRLNYHEIMKKNIPDNDMFIDMIKTSSLY